MVTWLFPTMLSAKTASCSSFRSLDTERRPDEEGGGEVDLRRSCSVSHSAAAPFARRRRFLSEDEEERRPSPSPAPPSISPPPRSRGRLVRASSQGEPENRYQMITSRSTARKTRVLTCRSLHFAQEDLGRIGMTMTLTSKKEVSLVAVTFFLLVVTLS